jgi:uncharacterized protein
MHQSGQHSFKIFFQVFNKKSKIHGMGTYAKEAIPAKRKIGSLAGEIISKKEADKRSRLLESIAIVELWNGKAIDASINSNELRFINHCCDPNTYMRVFNYHVEFYALKNIDRNEELTCDYGLTHHEGKLPCKCGAKNCKGFI